MRKGDYIRGKRRRIWLLIAASLPLMALPRAAFCFTLLGSDFIFARPHLGSGLVAAGRGAVAAP
jgi:hypothetical protein